MKSRQRRSKGEPYHDFRDFMIARNTKQSTDKCYYIEYDTFTVPAVVSTLILEGDFTNFTNYFMT